MQIIIYHDPDRLDRDLKYWSNALGELHYHGKYDIEEKDLPKPLRELYRDRYSDDTGSLCYLTEYQGAYGIALINEFDPEYARQKKMTMDELFRMVLKKADDLMHVPAFRQTKVLVGESTGVEKCHELVVFTPCTMDRATFLQVALHLYQHLYS